jgi:hypothetical protein
MRKLLLSQMLRLSFPVSVMTALRYAGLKTISGRLALCSPLRAFAIPLRAFAVKRLLRFTQH